MVGSNSRSLQTPCAAEKLQYNLCHVVRRKMPSYRLQLIGSYIERKDKTPRRWDRLRILSSYCHKPRGMDASRIL
jgi:hypothetical protein